MTIAVLEKIVPLDTNHGAGVEASPHAEANRADTSESELKQPTKELDSESLVELMADFRAYNKQLAKSRHDLEPIGKLLNTFSKDLKELSSSLVDLEKQSNDLTQDSKFNKEVTKRLEQVIQQKVLPPDAIKDILKEDLSNHYLEKVQLVLEKALPDAATLIEAKVMERFRDFMIEKIRSLRAERSTPSQNVQQQLLEGNNLYVFLQVRQPVLADQLKQAYFHTMRWYYKSKFAKYIYALEKVQRKPLDGPVFLRPIILSSFEQRLKALGTKERCIPSQLAETIPTTYYMEFILRQFLTALEDNATAEYYFVVEFFHHGEEKDHSWVTEVFGDVFDLSTSFLQYLVNGTSDIFGILLLIEAIQQARERLTNNHVPIIDAHLNSLLLQLWPMVTRNIDLNCEYLKRNIVKTPKSLAPLQISQQFGLFYLALLNFREDHGPISLRIGRVRDDFENGLTKASAHFKGVNREIFLYNNYFLVLNILKNEAAEAEAEIKHFQSLADAYLTTRS